MSFSANLGFLWTDLSLPDAIHAAHGAGFDAVECHWPYEIPSQDVTDALQATGLPMLGLNTRKGLLGESGLSALPGRAAAAKAAIDEALAYAIAINAQNIHVMAGTAEGPRADEVFRENLLYACTQAAPHGITILIEPLNTRDAPGYHLSTTAQARAVIDDVAAPNLKLMFDCYHVQIMEGDLIRKLGDLMPLIGHIQFASVPTRGAPDIGEVNFPKVFRHIRAL
jgi:hydroxypyruvate isomerase